MALRESVQVSEGSDCRPDLGVVTGRADGNAGVRHGEYLVTLADAVALWRWDEVAALREQGIDSMGSKATSDAILVASGFNGITRVADAIGIRLDARTASNSVDLRATVGIDAFAPTEKWAS